MTGTPEGVTFGSWVQIRSDKLEAEEIWGVVVAITGDKATSPCSIVRRVNTRTGPVTLSTLVSRIMPGASVDYENAHLVGKTITAWLRNPGALPGKNKTWWSEVAHRLTDLEEPTERNTRMNMSQKAQELRAAETAHRLDHAETTGDPRLRDENGRLISIASARLLSGHRHRQYGKIGTRPQWSGDPNNQPARRRWEKELAAKAQRDTTDQEEPGDGPC